MRALILLVAIVFILALIGWVTFGTGPGRSSVNLETDKIRQDTQQALESGAEALEDAKEAVRPTTDEAEPVRTTVPADPVSTN